MRARTRLLLLALPVALVLPGLAACGDEPDPKPTFSADDALPSELVAGQEYEAEVTVTFPADWPGPDEAGRSAMVGLVVDLGRGGGALICDSIGVMPADLPSVTLTCPFTAQAPTTGVGLRVTASTPEAGPMAEHVYEHTVAP